MSKNDAAPNEPERVTVTPKVVTLEARALDPEVTIKESIDRIGQIVKGTEEGVGWTKKGIKITIALSSVAIALAVSDIVLQYLKVI